MSKAQYAHLGEHVGASDVCMDCRDALADFSTGYQLCGECRVKRAARIAGDLCDPNNCTPAERGMHRNAIRLLVDENLWTLSEYLTWLNRDDGVSKLTEDLDHWREFGVTTASELGDYLDGCVAREKQKGMMNV